MTASEQSPYVRLHPSFIRATIRILVQFLLVALIAYCWQGYYQHLWWSRDYFLSLLIPFVIAPLVVCIVWVPCEFEFTDAEVTIHFLLRPVQTASWDDLQYYGWFRGVYGLQFHTEPTVTFYPGALPRASGSC